MISIPLENVRTAGLFKWAVTRELLLLLEKNRYHEFSIRELHRALGERHSLFSVQRSVLELETSGLVKSKNDGRKKLVSINLELVHDPTDPFDRIPQPEHRKTIRTIVERVHEEIKDLVSIVLFGSFAKGLADRLSDIDLLVIVHNARSAEKKAALIEQEAASGALLSERFRVNMIVEELEGLSEVIEENIAMRSAMREGIVLQGARGHEKAMREIKV